MCITKLVVCLIGSPYHPVKEIEGHDSDGDVLYPEHRRRTEKGEGRAKEMRERFKPQQAGEISRGEVNRRDKEINNIRY